MLMPDVGGGVEVRVHKDGSPSALAAAAGAGTVTGAALAAAVLRALGRRRRARDRARDLSGDGTGKRAPADPLAGTGALDHPAPRPADRAGAAQKAADDALQEVKPVKAWTARVDRFQQSRAWTAFPYAVVKKFGDDEAGDLAALIAYFGFLSLFPLLLVLITVLGFALGGHPSLQAKVLHSTLGQFPVIGDQLQRNVHSLHGSGVALVIGLGGSVYGGLGVTKAAQKALNQVWAVPRKARPGFLPALGRSLLLLVVVGGGILGTTVLTGIGAGRSVLGPGVRVATIAASAGLNVVLFAVAFRLLTARDVSWGDLVPGAVVAAVAWQVLQAVGGYYVGHQLKGMSQTYGFFAIVLGLLSWLYLEAQIVLVAAEVNVVKAGRLWPRSLVQSPLTTADERAYTAYAEVEERRPEEDVRVEFDRGAGGQVRGAEPVVSGSGDTGRAVREREGASIPEASIPEA